MGRITGTGSEKEPNREELLQMAIRTAKAGNREGARVMLRQVLSEDKRNERAIMWMAKISSSKGERRQWLERALEINPDNGQAKATLKKMQYRRSARENRTLLIFGVVVGVLVVLLIVVVVAIIVSTT
ncbi:MAG: tetratricopeptide repeat protein [Anaerolineae bacterium]|nr:tetratricopeptide repeat protein [Anaerolineae bacterium]